MCSRFPLFACAKPDATLATESDATIVSIETETEEAPVALPEEAPVALPEEGLGIKILLEQDDDMINNYSVLAVNDAAPFKDADGKAVSGVAINTVGAAALIDWLMSDEAAQLIANFGVAEYNEALFSLKDGKPVFAGEIPQAKDDTKTIRLSTTTSVKDSGLLDFILPAFESKYGYTVEVTSAGTGKAIAARDHGQRGPHLRAQQGAGGNFCGRRLRKEAGRVRERAASRLCITILCWLAP